MQLRRSIRRPGRGRRGRQRAQRQEDWVVVHAPAREVVPRQVPVGLEGDIVARQLGAGGVELGASDADRLGREVRIGRVGEGEEIGDAAQG